MADNEGGVSHADISKEVAIMNGVLSTRVSALEDKLETAVHTINESTRTAVETHKDITGAQINAVREAIKKSEDWLRELMGLQFQAMKEAVMKAEAAQSAYNERSNEFRAALDDSNKNNLTRQEGEVRFIGMSERMDGIENRVDELRITGGAIRGKSEGISASMAFIVTAAGLALAVIGLLIKISTG